MALNVCLSQVLNQTGNIRTYTCMALGLAPNLASLEMNNNLSINLISGF